MQKNPLQIQNSADLANEITRLLLTYKLTHEELITFLQQAQGATIPLAIFAGALAPLEAVVKYLKEQRNWKNKAIAAALKRSDKTISQAYRARARNTPLPTILETGEHIPLKVLAKSRLSMLECLVDHLLQHHTVKKIADLLGKDPRTISTVKSRIAQKHGRA